MSTAEISFLVSSMGRRFLSVGIISQAGLPPLAGFVAGVAADIMAVGLMQLGFLYHSGFLQLICAFGNFDYVMVMGPGLINLILHWVFLDVDNYTGA